MRHAVCSYHARIRAKQRGITDDQIDAVVRYADREAHRGNGCASIWISRQELQRLGPKTPEGTPTDRLRGLTVLESNDQTCVTVFRNRRSKIYRRNVRCRRRPS
jgi:hypothetical protein